MTLKLTRHGSPEAASTLIPDWKVLLEESGADVQFSPDWLAAWWRQFGTKQRLSLISVHDGDRLVALLPFVTARVRVGLRSLHVARLAGLLPYFAVLQFTVVPDRAEAVWRFLLAEGMDLLGPALLGADVLCLSQLSHSGEALGPLQAALRDVSPEMAQQSDETPRHALISLANSFDAYMAAMPGRRRSKQRKAKEGLEAKGITMHCLTGTDAREFLPEFIAHHNTQWHTIGRLGHFGDWPQNASFLADVLTVTNAGRFYVQRDGKGRFLAAQLRFQQGPTCLAMLTARDTSAEVAQMGIGSYAHFEMVARIIPEGVRRIDSGVGEYDHKISLGADMVPLSRIFLFRAETKKQVVALRRWSELVHLLYYRIWFLKLAPQLRRIGLARAPLWRYWRETRL